jgi:alkanesulfonate monooxygenase SsuD/methylene tetrahydromethanopterin reductase-like flavin-dependent oxidoreductase (luciferase family)
VRLGVVILPDAPWSEAAARWRAADAMRFEHAWTYDHLAWRTLRDATWFAAIPTLTAAALVTSRVRIGPLVASPNFREPVAFARELVSLDDVSGGRLTLGFGAGGDGWDATILGQQPWSKRERGARFREFVAFLDELLREPEVTRRGEFYAADEARTYPGCVQRPRLPFALAGTGPRAMEVAARYAQTWVSTGDRTSAGSLPAAEGARMIRGMTERLDSACTAVGRDPATLERLVLGGPQLDSGLASPQAFADTVGAYAEVGVTDFVVHWPSGPFAGDLATFERIFS